jgi:hypothetical protein
VAGLSTSYQGLGQIADSGSYLPSPDFFQPRRLLDLFSFLPGHLYDVGNCLSRRYIVCLGRGHDLAPLDVAFVVVLVLWNAAAAVCAHLYLQSFGTLPKRFSGTNLGQDALAISATIARFTAWKPIPL